MLKVLVIHAVIAVDDHVRRESHLIQLGMVVQEALVRVVRGAVVDGVVDGVDLGPMLALVECVRVAVGERVLVIIGVGSSVVLIRHIYVDQVMLVSRLTEVVEFTSPVIHVNRAAQIQVFRVVHCIQISDICQVLVGQDLPGNTRVRYEQRCLNVLKKR